MLTVAVLAFGVGTFTGVLPITATQVADAAGYFLLFLTLGFFGWLFTTGGWTAEERRRLYAIAALFLAAGIFWSVFEQAGSTLNLFADRNTRNELLAIPYPSSWFQSENSLFLWMLAPVFAWLWLRLGAGGRALEPANRVRRHLRRRRLRHPDHPAQHGGREPDVADDTYAAYDRERS